MGNSKKYNRDYYLNKTKAKRIADRAGFNKSRRDYARKYMRNFKRTKNLSKTMNTLLEYIIYLKISNVSIVITSPDARPS